MQMPAPSNKNRAPHVVVVGAGISGLTAAYRLQEQSKELRLRVSVTLLESGQNTGGLIQTVRNEFGIIEDGPEAIVTHKPAALNLIKDLGLGDRLVASSREASRTFVSNGCKLEPLPDGFIMFAPTRLTPLALSPLFSLTGKLRMALDLVLPPRLDDTDESLAAFVTRRLGREALEKLAEPLIAGIYATDANELSANCSVPRLKEIEREHRSIILGLIRAKRQSQQKTPMAAFLTLDDGLQVMTDELCNRLSAGVLRLNTRVSRVAPGLSRRWRVLCKSGSAIECDCVILATPCSVTAHLVREVCPQAAHELGTIQSGSTAMLSLIFRRSDVQHALDGSGFVVPANDGRSISACSFSSVKFKSRINDEYVLLRLFSRFRFDKNDSQEVCGLEASMQANAAELLGIRSEPVFRRFFLPSTGLPRYTVGHKDRVDQIQKALQHQPGLFLAGNAYNGIGISDCINSAEQAASAAIAHIYQDVIGSVADPM